MSIDTLQARSRSLQLQFNAVLFGVALLIVGLAVWIALAVADRLVRPVGQLVRRGAAGRPPAISPRACPTPRFEDEVGTLAARSTG